MSDLRRPSKNNPRGTEAYDLGALSPDQQLQLNEQKIKERKANEEYLLKHPEIKAVLEESLQFLLVNRPESGEEIRKVLSDFFKSKADELQATKWAVKSKKYLISYIFLTKKKNSQNDFFNF